MPTLRNRLGQIGLFLGYGTLPVEHVPTLSLKQKKNLPVGCRAPSELPQAKAFMNYRRQSTFAFVRALSGYAGIAAEGLTPGNRLLDSINAAVLAPPFCFSAQPPPIVPWPDLALCKQLTQLTVQTAYCRQQLRRVQAHRMSANYHELVDANGAFIAL